MKHIIGSRGEDAALSFLLKKGFRLVERNYRSYLGEIDLILRDAGTVAFVEVKAGRAGAYGDPLLRIHARKQMQIIRTALGYLKHRGWMDRDCRFDVVGVRTRAGEPPTIEHIENAFSADAYFR